MSYVQAAPPTAHGLGLSAAQMAMLKAAVAAKQQKEAARKTEKRAIKGTIRAGVVLPTGADPRLVTKLRKKLRVDVIKPQIREALRTGTAPPPAASERLITKLSEKRTTKAALPPPGPLHERLKQVVEEKREEEKAAIELEEFEPIEEFPDDLPSPTNGFPTNGANGANGAPWWQPSGDGQVWTSGGAAGAAGAAGAPGAPAERAGMNPLLLGGIAIALLFAGGAL